MPPPPRPAIPPGQHPLERGRYYLPTPMLVEVTEKAVSWITQSFPGNSFCGSTRMGKTTTRRYLRRHLPKQFPGILTYGMSCYTEKTPSLPSFFSQLCVATNHLLPLEAPGRMMRRAVAQFVISEVRNTGQDRVVFFFDEAQKWKHIQFDWLVDFTNDLGDGDIDPTMILLGQPELYDVRASLESADKENVIGRFMAQMCELRGVCSQADLEACLKCYDDPSLLVYPENSNWSYTRYYFLKAYDRGWRLANAADKIWEAFGEVKVRNGVPGRKLIVSLQDFTRTVHAIMTRIGPRNEASPRLSMEELTGIVVAAGFGVPSPSEADDDSDGRDGDEDAEE
jgi:hypothetical protein